MYDTLLRLYKDGKLTEMKLNNAVTKGWIKEEEKVEIIESVSAQ